MKKLMIAAAIACAAVVSQAATCTWNSGNLYTATSASGGWGKTSDYLVKNKTAEVTMQVFLLADADEFAKYSGKSQEYLYTTFSTQSADFDKQNYNTATPPVMINAITITEDASTALEGKEYAVVIATYHDATFDKDFYIANAVETTYNSTQHKGSAANIISSVGSTSGWQTAAAPEPTSGLLLLLGMAGLALRRRRA